MNNTLIKNLLRFLLIVVLTNQIFAEVFQINKNDNLEHIQGIIDKAKDGDVINFTAGTYEINQNIIIKNKKNIKLIGLGKVIIKTNPSSFILVTNCNNIVFSNLIINAIKFNSSNNITINKCEVVNSGTLWDELTLDFNSCTNINILNSIISNKAYPLLFTNCKTVNIKNNRIYNNQRGIKINESQNILISSNLLIMTNPLIISNSKNIKHSNNTPPIISEDFVNKVPNTGIILKKDVLVREKIDQNSIIISKLNRYIRIKILEEIVILDKNNNINIYLKIVTLHNRTGYVLSKDVFRLKLLYGRQWIGVSFPECGEYITFRPDSYYFYVEHSIDFGVKIDYGTYKLFDNYIKLSKKIGSDKKINILYLFPVYLSNKNKLSEEDIQRGQTDANMGIFRANYYNYDPILERELVLASKNNEYNKVKILIENGVIANSIYENVTALIWASYNGHIKIVELLIKKYADPNIQDKDGDTALMAAIFNGKLDVAKYLLNGKINIDLNIKNNKGKTALILAKEKGFTEIVNMIINFQYKPR